MQKWMLRLLSFIMLTAALSTACQTSKKGRQQPKRGPIPCPIKDC